MKIIGNADIERKYVDEVNVLLKNCKN